MLTISEEAKLLQKCTNHSLSATSVKVLDSANVPIRHIMTVKGHKSENSLKTYTGSTDSNTKTIMSHILSKSAGLKVNRSNAKTSTEIANDNISATDSQNVQDDWFKDWDESCVG